MINRPLLVTEVAKPAYDSLRNAANDQGIADLLNATDPQASRKFIAFSDVAKMTTHISFQMVALSVALQTKWGNFIQAITGGLLVAGVASEQAPVPYLESTTGDMVIVTGAANTDNVATNAWVAANITVLNASKALSLGITSYFGEKVTASDVGSAR